MVAVSIKMCQILHIQTLQKLKGYIHICISFFFPFKSTFVLCHEKIWDSQRVERYFTIMETGYCSSDI